MDKPKLDQSTPPRPHDIDRIPADTHPSKTTKTVNRLIAAALVICVIVLGVMLKWALQSTDVLQVNNSPFPARVEADPSGVTGGVVYLKIDYCKKTTKQGQVRISYLSASREQFIPIVTERIAKGCSVQEFPVVVPVNLTQDTYRIKFRATYDVNPLRKNVPIEFESQPVKIGIVRPAQ